MAYIYAYIRQSNGSPYYIGKGKGNRAWKSHKKHGITTPTNVNQIIIMEDNLSEIGALALERFYIRWYGRKCDSGILLNKTLGGDGAEGPKSDITKAKMRKPKSDAHKKKMLGNQNAKGRIKTVDEIERLRLANLGRKNTKDTISKMKKSQKKSYEDPHRRVLQKEAALRGWETRRKNVNG